MNKLFYLFLIYFFLPLLIFGQTSILNDGDWIKIGIIESGIYKIDKNFLDKNNIDIGKINPNKIQIYGSGYNGSLPQLNSISNYINPKEIQISFFGNSDDTFDNNEFVFFYLQSSDRVYFDSLENKLKSEKNIYTDTSFYFISFDKNLSREIKTDEASDLFDFERNNFLYNYKYEKDLYTIIQSGRDWYGEIFSPGNSLEIPINDFNKNTLLNIDISLISRSTVQSNFKLYLNNNEISHIDMGVINEGIYGYKLAETNKKINSEFKNQDSNNLKLLYNGDNSSISYLDYIDITGEINLSYKDNDLIFYTLPSNEDIFYKHIIKSTNIYDYDSQNKLDLRRWDITNPYDIKESNLIKENDYYYVIKNEKNFGRYIIFDIKNLNYPLFSKSLVNSNILNHKNPDLLIITHDNFKDDASRIKSLREREGLTVNITDVDNIYNQFSAGNQDISSIRNYIKYIYNSSNKKLRYVLLIGDCSYDFKDRIPNNTNYIPIYQSYNSSNNIYSYSSDDYYGFLDEDEGIWEESIDGDHDLEVGVGRIPSKSKMESKSYIDKLFIYSKKELIRGDWKKNIFLIADDGDNNVHQNDAENHFNLLNKDNPEYKIKKIYLDNYEQNIIDGFKTSSQTKELLNEAVDNGAMIINYIGHGNEFFWAEEKILDDNSIYSWKNRSKLPLFLTATCEFGKFDDPLISSGGEMLLNKDNGGAIALLTTTRPVFSQSNYRLNNEFYKNVFVRDESYMRLGDIFKNTKNGSLSGPINRNFALLGDPSLTLNYPYFNIKINKIDTLMAGDKILVSGEIIDNNSIKVENFNGEIYSDIFDKISTNITLGDENEPYQFLEWDDLIFKGVSSVNQGVFSFEFNVPKNIDYEFGLGKLNLFAVDTVNFDEAIGSSSFIIGGTSNNFKDDNKGPDINIFLDSYDFISGDRVSISPLLIVDLFDVNGINIIEKESSNKIKAVIDDTIVISLNKYFSYLKDNFQRGSIRFPLENLKNGKHKIEIKVSDNYNNLSTEVVVFITGNENKLKISNLMNYPNPFSYQTNFSFELEEYNQPIFILLEVFDIRGKKVFNYQNEYEFSPNFIDDISWDGKDLNYNPLPQGIYIYKLHVRNLLNGKNITLHNKLFKKL